jgi:Fe(3+) dicitrate transport protein
MFRFQPVRIPLPFCLLIVLCSLASNPLLAQTAPGGTPETDRDDTGTATAVVQGIVTTTENGLPLANALVEVEGNGTRVYTDRHGQYRLALSGGTATLRFARIGYSTRSEEVRLEAGQRLSLNVALSFESIALDPVVVLLDRTRMVGDAVQAGQLAGAAQLLMRADLEARPLLFDNVHEVLRQLPGVNVQDEEGYGLRPNIGLRGTGV